MDVSAANEAEFEKVDKASGLERCFSTIFEPRHTFFIEKIPRHTTS